MAETKWETCPNPQCRVMHTRRRLPMASCDVTDDLEALSDRQRMLIKSIRAIEGVEEVWFGGYKIQVSKGEMFTWEEIMPLVQRLVDAYLSK